ncbi:hypothetical protein [Pseudonocardia sp. GCM10023141]|uniref:hypothetical protein n=1 Tax=Pseudonocardia sp. GCM10023141 TaxID=3252653 RepID=UPI003617BAD3
MDGDEALQRADEDDYDLLTFGEAGARLTAEIGVQRARLADLRAAGDHAGADACQRRIDALVAAELRNSRRSFDETSFKAFFGYAPDPGRNGPAGDQ